MEGGEPVKNNKGMGMVEIILVLIILIILVLIFRDVLAILMAYLFNDIENTVTILLQ